ncbi:hypothetical protein DOY81_012258 [Sarcophaga bullata]|nr:hypothetical protein DOY81_012258 [Sarcophaga bullata]
MSDLPENLQTIKRERSPSSTPEEKSPNSIKAKLNLHVKRRLQDSTGETPLTAQAAASLVGIATTTTPQRKYKHKIKTNNNTSNKYVGKSERNNTEEQTATANNHNTTLTTGAISAGDEDEGGHDNDMKM